MNISTGGPHILLFERDQQLAPLVMSEFQLAGYECHVARTAVEVFDAIARYPIRLVLVNLAQAAAARREFWVALDTQRRGRGVQVFTFQCTNLAGYGAQIPDDRPSAMADMHVDGMLGLMNLVEAVRVRVPGTSTTNTIPRLGRTPTSTAASPPPAPAMSNLATPPALHGASGSYALPRTGAAEEPRVITTSVARMPAISPPAPAPAPAATPLPQPQVVSPALPPAAAESAHREREQDPQPYQTFTDKIHAVLYPTPRTRLPQPHPQPQHTVSAFETSPMPPSPAPSPSPSPDSSALQRLAHGLESSLAQLSRMVQESRPPAPDEYARQTHQTQQGREANAEKAAPQASEPLSMQPLRASPIRDLPLERGANGQTGSGEDMRRQEHTSYGHMQMSASAPVTPLASITAPFSSAPPEVAEKQPQTPVVVAKSEPQIEEVEDVDLAYERIELAAPAAHDIGRSRETKLETKLDTNVGVSVAADNALLLDIVQSLPPMPSPPPQQQVLSGRATRSLGSVLLEGHLVPQSRLEVAQGIQRMLRGVDLNYQLGEILLMFKLLTPDQLLAASLVSYGMITTQQIASLGRIRQELHSIGLEYDLENLLILFRILTAEQLREVRSSWQ